MESIKIDDTKLAGSFWIAEKFGISNAEFLWNKYNKEGMLNMLNPILNNHYSMMRWFDE